jgi:hypothetical protein
MNMAFLDNLKNIFNKKESSQANPIEQDIQGSQRSLSEILTTRTNYNLEIEEYPIREPKMARTLLEMGRYCYEVYHSAEMATEDCFSSSDGDDQGWTIADTLEGGETPVNPDLYAIAMDLKARMQDGDEYVIGGDRLKTALEKTLVNGDCFLNLGFEKDGISKNYCIARTLFLPSWDCFRLETDKGELQGFEQRKYLTPSSTDSILFNPNQIIHFRRKRRTLYGQSWFQPAMPEWIELKKAREKLITAATQALAPTVHKTPVGWTEDQRNEYRRKIEDKRTGNTIMLDIFAHKTSKDGNGDIDIERLKGDFPDLSQHIDNVLFWKRQMIPAGVPDYYFGTGRSGATKEISKEPARRYARMRNNWCASLTKGIKKAIDLEIRLAKGDEWFYENARNQYRIIWPRWDIDSQGSTPIQETKNPKGMEDLDD